MLISVPSPYIPHLSLVIMNESRFNYPLLSRTPKEKAKIIHHLLNISRINIPNPYTIQQEHPTMNRGTYIYLLNNEYF